MNAELLLAHYDRISDAPDAVARLRKFILDLAVRGKLLKQDSKEEPAADLLTRIQKEKTQLVKDGELKKFDLAPLPLNKDFPFPLPPSWAASDLQSLCISVTDGDHLPPPKQGHGIPLLVIGNIRDHSLSFEGCRHVSLQYYNALDSIRKPRKRDILYSLVGSYGIPVLINDDRQFCVQRHIGILRPSRSVNAIFLARVLKSKWVLDQATTFATGIAQKTVALSGLRKILIPLPPFAEQHRIVAKLDHLMGVCDRLEAAQHERETRRDQLTASAHHHLRNGEDSEELSNHAQFFIGHLPRLTKRPDQIKQLRQTILNLAVRGKLVPQTDADEPVMDLLQRIQTEQKDLIRRRVIKGREYGTASPADEAFIEIPQTWQFVFLGKILTFGPQNGISPTASSRPEAPRSITLTATTSGTFKSEHFKQIEANIPADSEFWIRQGDLLFQRGNTREYVGMAAYYDGEPGQFLYPDLIIKVRPTKSVDLRYIHLCSTAPYARAYFGRNASGAQSTMPKINHDILVNLPIPLPPFAEQHRIVAKVDELMALCDKLEARLSTAQTETSRLLESVLHHALEASA